MFLTVHAVSGLVIGKYLTNPLLAFLAGFLSHYLLDAIPHDPKEWKKWQAPANFKFFFTVMFVELPLMAVISIILIKLNYLPLTTSTLFGVLGAVAPDFLFGLNDLFPGLKIFLPFKKMNNFVHVLFSKKKIIPTFSIKYWLPLHLFFLFIFLYILIK
jgi:hypothetical protein